MKNPISQSPVFSVMFVLVVLCGTTVVFGIQESAITSSTVPASSATQSPLEFYMHDILGGIGASAEPVTGLLGNIYNGHVPFARRFGFIGPTVGAGFGNQNGVVPTNVQGVPLGSGLSGTNFAQPGTTGNVQTQLGPDGLSLGFGTITVIDDQLTALPDLVSPPIGKAQGVYVASSADGLTQMMAFTALLEGGEYGDSLNVFGIYHVGVPMSKLSVVGGTGKFKHATGFAEIRPLITTGPAETDGSETLLKVLIHLAY